MDNFSLASMNYFDLGVVLIIAIFALKSSFAGFIKELSSLVGIIGGLYLAFRYATDVGSYIHSNIFALPNDTFIYLLGFFVCFVAVALVIAIIGSILSTVFSLSGLGIVNRLLGFLFGGFKIFLILSVLLALVYKFNLFTDLANNFTSSSQLSPYLLDFGNSILNIDFGNINLESSNSFLQNIVDSIKNMFSGVFQGNSSSAIGNITS